MSPLALLLITLLLLGLAILAERELLRRRSAGNRTVEAIAADVSEDVSQLAHDTGATLRRATNKSDPKLANKFKLWADERLTGEPEIRDWLLSLPPVALRALTMQLDGFCQELNIRLAWLVDETLDTEPAAREVVRDVVLMYCRNCLRAVELQPRVNAFRGYQDVLAQIRRGEAQTFGQKLLSALQQAGLVTSTEPSLVLATPAERRHYTADSIREAAKRDQEAFYNAWAQVEAEVKDMKASKQSKQSSA